MGTTTTKITSVSYAIMNGLARLEARGISVSPQMLTNECGYILFSQINGQVKFLVEQGYIKKTGKSGTCHVRLATIRGLPDECQIRTPDKQKRRDKSPVSNLSQ